MQYFVADSVAGQVHKRTIDQKFVDGLPLALAVLIIDAVDGYGCSGDEFIGEIPCKREYREGNNIGLLEVDSGRGHYYGIVFSPTYSEGAKVEAQNLLASWNPPDDE